MLLVRSPLRISLGGGGTDLPSYYQQHGGFLIAGAINKYVYVALQQTFVPELILRYSQYEKIPQASAARHPLIREALALMQEDGRYLEITSLADIPAGTGLGSSGSFGVALLKALHLFRQKPTSAEAIAALACQLEIELLKEPVGKQDQYISAVGGLTCFEFLPDETVRSWPLLLAPTTQQKLEDNLLLFFTGYSRAASTLLQDQDKKSRSGNAEMLQNLHDTKELGLKSKHALESGDLLSFGQMLNEHWQRKRKRSAGMSNPRIDELYDTALAHGAIGGKLIGAGGGGFLLFYTEEKEQLRRALAEKGLSEVDFSFDDQGVTTVF